MNSPSSGPNLAENLPEFSGDPALFERLLDVLVETSGMVTLRERRSELGKLLRDRINRLPPGDRSEYIASLWAADGKHPEILDLLDHLTIGETYFFRHPEVFFALEASIFPSWIKSQELTFSAWSAACSNGAEAYSISILWREFLRQRNALATGPQLQILGTDLNRDCIAQARSGDYGKWSLRNLCPHAIATFFEARDGRQYIRSEYRHGVTFQRFNLLDPPHLLGLLPNSLDLIFCRNVLIYFSQDVITKLLGRFLTLLRPGGWLIPGASECAGDLFVGYETVNFPGAVLYRRPGAPLSPEPEALSIPGEPLVKSWICSAPMEEIPPSAPLPATYVPPAPDFTSWEPPVLPPRKRISPANEPTPSMPAQLTHSPSLEELAAAFPPENPAALEATVRKLLLVDEMNADLHYLLALLSLLQNRENEAETSLRRALYLDRNHAGAQIELTRLLFRQGRTAPAGRALRVAQKILRNLPPKRKTLCHNGWLDLEQAESLLETVSRP